MPGRTLYWLSGSAPAWRAWATLKAKGLDAEVKRVDLANGENMTAEFLKMNPRHKIPVLVDNDVTVYESAAIMEYLERAYPEPPLMPKDNQTYALAAQRFHEEKVLYAAVQPLFHAKMTNAAWKEDTARWQEAVDKAHTELGFFEQHLSSDPDFLAGNAVSLADLALATTLLFIIRGGATLQKYPHVRKYAEAMSQHPAIAETWPPHWKESPNQDWLAETL